MYDSEPERSDLQARDLVKIFLKLKPGKSSELQAANTEKEGSIQQCADVAGMRNCIGIIKTVREDARLLESLLSMERKLQELESKIDE